MKELRQYIVFFRLISEHPQIAYGIKTLLYKSNINNDIMQILVETETNVKFH